MAHVHSVGTSKRKRTDSNDGSSVEGLAANYHGTIEVTSKSFPSCPLLSSFFFFFFLISWEGLPTVIPLH